MLMLLVCNHFVYLFHSLLQFCKQSRYIVRFVDTTLLGCAISTVTDSSLMDSSLRISLCKQNHIIVVFADTTLLGCAISTVTDSSFMFSLSHVFIVWTKSHYCYACWYNSARLCNFNRDRLLPRVFLVSGFHCVNKITLLLCLLIQQC